MPSWHAFKYASPHSFRLNGLQSKKVTLKFKVKAGENGKLFGGVTAKEIAETLKKDYNINI